MHVFSFRRVLQGLLLLTSLCGYLEWGEGMRMFLFQAAVEVIGKAFSDPMAVLHPLIVLPLLGLALWLINLFRARPGRRLLLLGLGGMLPLFLVLLTVGILARNPWIVLSTVPFLVSAGVALARWNFREPLG